MQPVVVVGECEDWSVRSAHTKPIYAMIVVVQWDGMG